MAKLNKDEQELLESVEAGEWKSVKNLKQEIKTSQEMARKTLKKNRRINIRMTEQDVRGLQAKALKEGLPYQTLVSSILHKYVSGQLIEDK